MDVFVSEANYHIDLINQVKESLLLNQLEKACEYLWNFSEGIKSQEIASHHFDAAELISITTKIMEEMHVVEDELYVRAVSVAFQIAKNKYVLSNSSHDVLFVNMLICKIKNHKRNSLVQTSSWEILYHLCKCRENKEYFGTDCDFLSLITEMSQSPPTIATLTHLLGIFNELGYIVQTKQWLVSANRNVEEFRVYLMQCLSTGQSRVLEVSNSSDDFTHNMVPLDDYCKIELCKLIASMCYVMRGTSTFPEFSTLLPTVTSYLSLSELPISLVRYLMTILANLSGNPEMRQELLAPNLQVVSVLVKHIIRKDHSDDIDEVALRFFWGLLNSQSFADRFLSDSTLREIIPLVLHRIHSTKKKQWPCRFLVRLAEYGSLDMINFLLEMNAHIAVIKLVKDAGDDSKKWNPDGHVQHCLSFLMHISVHEISVNKLKECNLLQVLEPILRDEQENYESLKAIIIFAFLVGRDEDKDNVLNRPGIIDLIVNVLESVLKGVHCPPLPGSSKGCRYGTFGLSLLLKACLQLSVSTLYKSQLASNRFVAMLINGVVYPYVHCMPSITPPSDSVQFGYGGGSDVESAQLAIYILLQLSFFVDDLAVLQSGLMNVNIGLLELLLSLLNPTNEQSQKLSDNCKTSIMYLKYRVDPQSILDQNASEMPSLQHNISVSSDLTASSHIMISYAWKEDAKPNLTKLLRNALRDQYNYDVWRDIEGSSIYPKMNGSVNNCMGEAVDMSSFVIICISEAYKKSTNCQSEARYALMRQKANKLKIIYVSMQENYAPDGWLGIAMGDQLWYPLYSENNVNSTAAEIAHVIGNCSDLNTLPPLLRSFSSFTINESSLEDSLPNLTRLKSSSSSIISRKSTTHYSMDSMSTAPATASTSSNLNGIVRQMNASHAVRFQTNTSTAGMSQFEMAYDCLTNARNCLIPSAMSRSLNILGVFAAADLLDIENETLIELAEYLKEAKRKQFLRMLPLYSDK